VFDPWIGSSEGFGFGGAETCANQVQYIVLQKRIWMMQYHEVPAWECDFAGCHAASWIHKDVQSVTAEYSGSELT
jgi:hypothetical protein